MNIDFSKIITAEERTEKLLENKRKIIAERRYLQEVSGLTLDGIKVDTGRDSQGLINGAVVSCILDENYVCNWKTPNGFVSLDAVKLKSIAVAIRKHVQACFDRESQLLGHLTSGTFEEDMLEVGWPTYEQE